VEEFAFPEKGQSAPLGSALSVPIEAAESVPVGGAELFPSTKPQLKSAVPSSASILSQ
jgi:hypothetical protein